MALYPESPIPSFPVLLEPEWKTIISATDSGKEQRRQKALFAKYNVRLMYQFLTSTEEQILWTFYQARKGAFETFFFYDLYVKSHEDLFVGWGDGEITTFDIPGKSTSGHSIYVDGSEQSGNYSILTGGGSEDSDRVQFDSAPSSGQLVTCDLTGFLRARCRFKEDKLTRNAFTYLLYTTGIELKGLAPE